MGAETIYQPHNVVSLEISPPRVGEGKEGIYNLLKAVTGYNLAAVNVTWGALKSQRPGSLELASEIVEISPFSSVLHLPASRRTYHEIQEIALKAQKAGIVGLVALQGDDQTFFENGPKYASDIVKQVHTMRNGLFLGIGADTYDGFPNETTMVDDVPIRQAIGVAAYPQIHPSSNLAQDLHYLRLKQEFGADYGLTQAIFDKDIFDNWMNKVVQAGVSIPIIPSVPVLGSLFSFNIFHQHVPGVDFPADYVEKMDELKTRLNNTDESKHLQIKKEIRQRGEDLLMPLVTDYIEKCGHVHIFAMGNVKGTHSMLEAIAKEHPEFRSQ